MKLKFALAGNPNCGKTTMFNALTGANQYVGNWPGVTVEKKEGRLRDKKRGDEITVTDLPGIYSLSPYTLEEVVSRNYLLDENPDVIIDLVDATNIERNLYLTTQLIETGIPVVIALNMSDLVEKRGLKIDTKRLSMLLNCPVIETSALKKTGLEALIDEAVKTAHKKDADLARDIFSGDIEASVSKVEALLENVPSEKKRWYAVKVLENDSKAVPSLNLSPQAIAAVNEERKLIEEKKDDDIESVITDERYKYIQKLISTTVKKSGSRLSASDRIDSIVTNRILGIPIFIAVMFVVYYWTNDTFGGWVGDIFSSMLAAVGAGEVVTSLVVDGIIGGLVAVLGFVPQMAILFLFLSILEDCGYMVRIAFVMDRVFRHFGLSGKSFIPLLISSGCGIPGIMASRTIEQDNDRRLTIMTATFIPCGAKLPVISLMAGVMGGAVMGYQESAWVAPLTYFLGIAAVLVSAIILKKTKPFSGKPAPFVMELPPYRIPTQKSIFRHTWEKGRQYLRKMGGIILICSIFIWFLGYFPRSSGQTTKQQQENSYLCKIGQAIEPVMKPLGFDWQMDVGIIAGVGAKELIVSSLGVMYSNEKGDLESGKETSHEETHSDDTYLQQALSKSTTPQSAIAYLVFVLLYFPCLATIVAIKNESGKWKWALFTAGYTTLLAYTMSFIAYRIALLF